MGCRRSLQKGRVSLPLDFLAYRATKLIVTQSAWWTYAGTIDYGEAWQWQQRLVEARRANLIPDVLFLCEHPHVITVGRRVESRANILSHQFPIYEVERGGDATYHGPGQLVGYPILRLGPEEQDPHALLRRLETALCSICEDAGVPATVKNKYTGVWTQDQARKLASLGVAIRHGISFHGFALNVTTDLSCFQTLNPCGLASSVMTSLAQERTNGSSNPRSGLFSVSTLLPPTVYHLGHQLGRVWESVEWAHLCTRVLQSDASP